MERDRITELYAKRLRSVPLSVSNEDWSFAYLAKFLPEDRNITILDAGCGNGRYAYQFANDGYKNVIAIDLFEELDTGGHFLYKCSSIDAMDIPDASVDFAICLSAIFYLPNPSDGFAEFYRVMRAGGILIISAHTRYSLFTLDRIVRRFFGKAEHLKGIKFYSAKQYTNMMQAIGFEIVDVDGFNLLYSPGNILFRGRRWLARTLPGGEWDASRLYRGAAWLKWARSISGYHSLIAARKPLSQR